mmetsp:Transcript_54425/g.172934  ORF Transcript_54425/g.172934 Transcript_54425/m.172934 type:complete len:379 (-) Transcript_54425:23-1159(-)|eukprot:CAMPEP_0182904702 /NCGR_PEP_ID=MMETSP0034_2-20130328/32314_1 /TAXON_ID=156128 /ORGANISM="Nephroselmis pyriformis, Strain CCMP717" /LENGTH=378 /DNA_ID=CAMNT_0025039909 /DNA_START=105 /DNA_END=1241 /DNA_ORIENTATION=-
MAGRSGKAIGLKPVDTSLYLQQSLHTEKLRSKPAPGKLVPNWYENEEIVDQDTAQEYYQYREIKLRELALEDETTYKKDYPEWPLPDRQKKPPAEARVFPGQTGKTSYQDDFIKKQLPAKHVREKEGVKPTAPFKGATTYNKDFVKRPMENNRVKRSDDKPHPNLPFTGATTYQKDYLEKPIPLKVVRPKDKVKDTAPFEGIPTYKRDYIKHPLPVKNPKAPAKAPKSLPFKAITTHGDHFQGWKLPKNRGSLGVETVGDKFFVLIPKSKPAPTVATQLFTTVRDNQETACIMVLQGEDKIASKNELLGQFDVINIPPAPHDVPQIVVTFTLKEGNVLTAHAHDLDADRHFKWLENGGCVIMRPVEGAGGGHGVTLGE